MMERVKNKMIELYQMFETIVRILLVSHWRKGFKSGKTNSPVFILGNGPSLTSGISDWYSEVENSHTVGVNLFVQTDLYSIIRPEYYIINAPEHYMESGMDEEYYIMQKNIFQAMGQKTTWKMELFIPWPAKKYSVWKSYLGKNENIKISYFNHTPAEGLRFFRHWVYSKNLGMPRPHNVLVPSIMLMILKGYRDIKLLGADHSWIQNISVANDNTVLVNQKHFYDSDSSLPAPMKKLGSGKRRLHEVLLKFMRSFEAYFSIEEYAKSVNAHIINCTEGSFIDAFDRQEASKRR